MDDDFIVAAFVVVDKTMQTLGHRGDVRARASDAAVLTVAIVAARYFQGHLARALQVMRLGHYLSGPLSVSRFNRRLHALRGWLGLALDAGGALRCGEALPDRQHAGAGLPSARARRCRKVSGQAFCGFCAAKREKFFGCGLHDLTPIHEMTYGLPADATVYGDKGYNGAADEATILADTGSRLVPIRRTNMAPNRWPCAPTASASRPATANWRRWASSDCAPPPSPTPTSNHRISITESATYVADRLATM